MHKHSQIFCVTAAISVLLLLQNIDLNRFIAKCLERKLKFYIKNTKSLCIISVVCIMGTTFLISKKY